MGKTQLALEYAHRHADDYDLVWWVTAEQPAAIPAQLVAFARRLGLAEQADQLAERPTKPRPSVRCGTPSGSGTAGC